MKLTILLIFMLSVLSADLPGQKDTTKNKKTVNTVKSNAGVPLPQQPELPISDSLVIPSLDFRSADIRDVLRSIAVKYKLNIWLAPEVRGQIPVHLTNIKVKDAIKFRSWTNTDGTPSDTR